MKLDPHSIALWLSIVGGVSGLYLRVQKQNTDDQRKRDALVEQISYQNASIALLIQMLPDDKRQLMESIQAAQDRQLRKDTGLSNNPLILPRNDVTGSIRNGRMFLTSSYDLPKGSPIEKITGIYPFDDGRTFVQVEAHK